MSDFNFPPGTKRADAIDELITDGDLKEIVLKQFNYMRIKGINLVKKKLKIKNNISIEKK